MNKYCPECGIETEWVEFKQPEIYEIRGEQIEVETKSYKCTKCNTLYEDMNSENDPYSLAYMEYRMKNDMVNPSAIIKFRDSYNLTQKELGGLMGLGSVTLSRYENGALQDDVHDQLLKFIFNPSNLLKTIIEKPKIISEDKRNKLILRLKKESQIEFYITQTSNTEPDLFNGFNLLDMNKIIESIKYFTFSQSVFKTKLLKLLFYSDFKYFKNYKKSITGLQYARLPFGPVPERYENLLGIILNLEEGFSVESKTLGNCNGEVLISKKPSNLEILNEGEIKVLRFVQDYFVSFSVTQIEEYSHKEKGYFETEHCKLISYDYANELSI